MKLCAALVNLPLPTGSRSRRFCGALFRSIRSHSGARLNRPRLVERALEIPAENEFDVPAGIVPAHQAFGQIVDPLCIVDAVEIQSPGGLNSNISSIQIDVAPDAGVLHPDQFGQVVDVIQYMLDGDSSRGPDKGADHGNSHDASLRRHAPDGFIRLAAG